MTNRMSVLRTDALRTDALCADASHRVETLGMQQRNGKKVRSIRAVLTYVLGVMLIACSVVPMGVLRLPSFADPGEESGSRLKALGIVQGDSQGDLLLTKNLTRVELAILLSRLYGEEWKASTYTQPSAFKDEATFPKWGARYIAYAQHRGWLVGDGAANFNPSNHVSGEELAVLLLRILGYEEVQWGKNAAELQKLTGIAVRNNLKPMLRGDLFDVLWAAVSKPVMKDGTTLIDKIDSANGLTPGSKEKKIRDAIASMVRLEGYESVGWFNEGYALVTREKDGKTEAGFIDKKGNLVVPFSEDYTHNVFMGMNRFVDERSMFLVPNETGSKHGFIDQTGKVVIEPKYDDASIFNDGLAYVEEGKKWYYIDVNGKVVFQGPSEYQAGGHGTRVSQMTMYHFEEGLAMIRDSLQRQGFIDKKGKVFIKPSDTFDRADFFEEDLAVVVKRGPNHDEKWGFINKKGELVVNTIYDEANSFREGLAAVRTGSFDCPSWGYIDKSGKVAIPLQYCYATSFEDGLAFVANGSMQERKGGYIDKSGNVVVPFAYSMGRPFQEDRAVVMKDGYYGYIDKTGKKITDFVFDEARSFEEGMAVVSKNGRAGIIGLDGAFLVEPIYDWISPSPTDQIYVLKIGTVYWILNLEMDEE